MNTLLFQAMSLNAADTLPVLCSADRIEKYGDRMQSLYRELQELPHVTFTLDAQGHRHAVPFVSPKKCILQIIRCLLRGHCRPGCACSECPELTARVQAAVQPFMDEHYVDDVCTCPDMFDHDRRCSRLRIGEFVCCTVLWTEHEINADRCLRCNATKQFIDRQ